MWIRCLISVALVAIVCACARPHAEGAGQPEARDEHPDGVVELPAEAVAGAGIRTEPVTERALAGELSTTGHVDFDQDRLAHVSPRITGRVHRVRAVLGQDVRAGDTLAEIDSIELGRAKAELLQARARQDLARTSYERERRLFEEGIVSDQEVQVAEAERREATAVLRTAEETLHLYGLDQRQVDALRYDDPKASVYPLQAPFAGTIVERHATLGELVTPERNLFTLAGLERVWIWIDVYQRDLGRVHLGDGVRARIDAYPDAVFVGEVSYLSSQVDADTRTVRARIDVPNPERRLRPGMFVQVELSDPHVEEGQTPRSPVVPESAIQRDGDASFVFVAAGPNRFARREILTGRRSGGWVELLEGPEIGAEVVVEGAFLLKSTAARESLGEGHAH
ncbi:MAG TPA: efflux RND transporter periplasmic adaptor subunit [Thermoanaerobaculia bacterium]|jgi:cobalt-zinc-cadmium efflux system membrane fusion protein